MPEHDRGLLGVTGRDEQARRGELVEGVGWIVGQDGEQDARVDLRTADRDRLDHGCAAGSTCLIRSRTVIANHIRDRLRGGCPNVADEFFDEHEGAGTPFGDSINSPRR